MTIRLYDNDGGDDLGTLTEEQLRFLVENLEEETAEDQDYWLTGNTLELLESRGLDPQLAARLRGAIGDRDGVEIRWSRR